MENELLTKLQSIQQGLGFVIPELLLVGGIVMLVIVGLIKRSNITVSAWLTLLIFFTNILHFVFNWSTYAFPQPLFENALRVDDFSSFFRIIIDGAAMFTVMLSMAYEPLKKRFTSEYFVLLLSATLGAHLLAMSMNMIMIFISMELLSISSYVVAGYHHDNKGAEGSMKYFLFGSVASAVMLYGFTILFGLSGTLDFSSDAFVNQLINNQSELFLVAGVLSLAGFLYKIAAAPMHPWAPDVYEAAPMPIVAFLSTVPKLAGLAVLTKFTLALNLFGETNYDWQFILACVAMLSITIGNFSALWQHNPKRMMAYSSIAQAGFLVIGIVAFSIQGIQFMLFYATVYVLMNFAVFAALQLFEKASIIILPDFLGVGKRYALISVVLFVGLIGLAGIPPTGGFSGKLFLFTALWDAYQQSGKSVLLWLLIFGLVNTVISLFFYLKIPYYSFIKASESSVKPSKSIMEYGLGLILALVILFLFIQPGLLMGWLNRINFVL